ncbi:MAG: murG [Alphaproteobacteria bacterium]|jgi:UDP-N-acetylglucosamine--N-acetylmuramyl-(pentapeptide) pyrophosphoryl-undecaprenol N-acetylglucosamine transferase|nr:murG [Alphaproteobacteria bacterium]
MAKTIILSSGGTGGHVFPALSLATELHAHGYHVVIMTDHRGQAFQQAAGVMKVISLPVWRGGGYARLGSILLFIGLTVSFFVALGHMLRFRPLAVVGFGGYPSLPAVLAGKVMCLPTALHEQNAVLGRANRLLARIVKRIAVSYQTVKFTEAFQDKVILTGNPVRKSIIAVRGAPYQSPGPEEPFRVLIIGGSQGARIFSSVIPKALCELPQELRQRLVVDQQCRKELLDITTEAYRQSGISVNARPFFEDMDRYLREAHLVIGRAGASTIAELTASGRPAILVPFAAAADNHQQANAAVLGESGAALVVLERDFNAANLQKILVKIMGKDKILKTMAQKMYSLGQPDATVKLAQMVRDLLSEGP